MSALRPVNAIVFKAIQQLDVETLTKLPEVDLQVILPCLVRISLISPVDIEPSCTVIRQTILCILAGIEHVNSIVALLSIDFHLLETNVIEEQAIRQKHINSNLLTNEFGIVILENKPILNGISLEFERSDSTRRIRLVIYELMQIQKQKSQLATQSTASLFVIESDLFDNDIYLQEIADVICITLSELPSLFSIIDIVDLLLYLRNGSSLIAWIVCNFPDSFIEVCFHIIENSEKDNDDSFSNQIRFKTLKELCTMNPSDGLIIRSKAIELNRMATLAIYLTLNQSSQTAAGSNDLVQFLSGLLLGADQANRNWFAQYVRNRQKKKTAAAAAAAVAASASTSGNSSVAAAQSQSLDYDSPSMIVLQLLRSKLIDKLIEIKNLAVPVSDLGGGGGGGGGAGRRRALQLCNDKDLVRAAALLKLYCAMRGIGGIKFQDDEIAHLLNVITLHATATAAGVRFISLGLCTLIACPSLISQSTENEKRCIEWIQHLIREDSYFTVANRVTDSFGEMLLLMAIHFHSNQSTAISDLVCGTLGMRVLIRSNSLSRIRLIFVQEIFTEQIVAAHAIKVPVTTQLNATISGFLPIHCIYQLIKSRVFFKYRINIKQWIYRQILVSTSPMHPIWSSLIDTYLLSLVNHQVYQATSTDLNTILIGEAEILDVFIARKDNGVAVYYDCDEQRLTPQILLIYFVLVYEDHCLNKSTLKPFYSMDFIRQLPIKYLMQKIHSHPATISYSAIFGALLRLLATNHPHLYLDDDLLNESNGEAVVVAAKASNQITKQKLSMAATQTIITVECVREAMRAASVQPHRTLRILAQLDQYYTPMELWTEFLQVLVSEIGQLLDLVRVPRDVQELYTKLWLKLNSVLPITLWTLTIDALLKLKSSTDHRTANSFSQNNQWYLNKKSITDPLTVLSCDIRVFRCAPILKIVLRVLKSNLARSRSELSRHIKTTSLINLDKMNGGNPLLMAAIGSNQMIGDQERDELRMALIAAQESAAVQMLLDRCLVDRNVDRQFAGFDWALRECRTAICSFLHQMFIVDPSLAKLVHFQGYARELLEITVSGIPSMHICLDFIPELLSLPDWDKQVFAIHLIAHLAVRYALPKSLAMAKLSINTLHTLIEVMPSNQFVLASMAILDDLPLICQAFPILNTDVIDLLTRIGRICRSLQAINSVTKSQADVFDRELVPVVREQIRRAYESIVRKTVLQN